MPHQWHGASKAACGLQDGRVVAADVEAHAAEEAARRERAHSKVLDVKALQEAQVAEKAARLEQARPMQALPCSVAMSSA